jgi:ribonuclease HI
MTSRATIISDASFDPSCGAAAWGAWIKADGRSSAIFSGRIKHECRNSTDAKMCALANGLAKAVAAGLIDDDMEVMLQSDSTIALGIVRRLVPGVITRQHKDSANITTPKRPHVFAGVRGEAATLIAEIAERRRLAIIICHVCGHTAGGGRQCVNRTVDRAAKAARKETN